MRAILEKVLSGHVLDHREGEEVFGAMMDGLMPPLLMAALLAGLRVRGEAPGELASLARVMMGRAIKIHPKRRPLVDTCGTGGDGQGTLNISTLAALVVAGAGIPVAKHGNRSVSSKCGSADVLEALGLNVALSPEDVEGSIDETGFGFLFAPLFHPAMAHAAPVRKELGVRTIFNMLGPMVNPAGVEYQVVGVPTVEGARTVAHAFQSMGKEKVIVIHGMEGLDEVSPQGDTLLLEVTEDGIVEGIVTPSFFGYPSVPLDELRVGGKEEAKERALRLLRLNDDPALYAVLMEGALAIYCAGKASTILEGARLAEESLFSKRALGVLERAVEFSQRVRS